MDSRVAEILHDDSYLPRTEDAALLVGHRQFVEGGHQLRTSLYPPAQRADGFYRGLVREIKEG